jgi:hypothetical protein
MRLLIYALLALVALGAGDAQAATIGSLFRQCDRLQQVGQFEGQTVRYPKADSDAVSCLWYMTAVIEFVFLIDADTNKPMLGICAPAGLGMPQALQVFINHARARPESWHERAQLGIMRSFSTAFPCRSG